MAVKSTKGLKIYLENMATTPPKVLVPTTITKGAPTEVDVADTLGLADGDLVTMSDTGFPELDGKRFVVGGLDATAHKFDLIGSDTTLSAGTLGTSPKATWISRATDMTLLCLSAIGIAADTAGAISVATFCDPSATISGAVAGAGVITLQGYVDIADAGYALLIDAEADGVERELLIEIPGQGFLLARGTISSFVISDIPIDGSSAYTAELTLSSKPVHRFD